MQANHGVAAMGTMTTALRAQRLLAGMGIATRILSLSPEDTRLGCAYGIEYDLNNERSVRQALREARVTVTQYLRRNGDPL